MSGFMTRARIAAKAAVGVFSENSAREAFGMLAGIYPGQQGLPPPRGTREYLQAYSKMPWLRAVTSRIASRVAATDWQLFVNAKAGEKARLNRIVQRAHGAERRKMLKQMQEDGELRQIETHPLLTVLTDANNFQTGLSARKTTQLHLDLVGEAFWLKERDALGTVVGVWPIPPDWIMATPTPAHRFFRVNFRSWRGLIPDTEILWFTDPDPSFPYGRGSGTAQALADELETDEYAAKHTKAFFFNRARPDLIVYPKTSNMREADVRRLEDDWLSRNQGFWRAFKPYFLTREVGVHETDQNFRSMQLVQLREHERDAVMQCFGVPPEILGVLDNANRATITAADLIMARYVIEPRLEFQRAVMQERLVPEYDERLILEFISPVQDDKDFQLEVATAAKEAFSIDELRALGGLGPLEGDRGRVHMVPNTHTPMDPQEGEGLIAPEPEPAPEPAVPAGGVDETRRSLWRYFR